MKLNLSLLFVILTSIAISQNVGINSNGASPNTSAMLDVDVSALSTKKGILIPRITSAQKTAMNPLGAAAQGLLIYQTDGLEGFYYNTSTTTTPNWVYLLPSSTSGAGWTITGNSGTTASAAAIGSTVSNNFIGTTDAIDFVLATNNLERMRINSAGLFGIGTNTLGSQKFEVLTSNSALNAIYGAHSSTAAASVYSGVQGALTGAGTATTGSLAYHNSSDKRFAVYGSGGDLAGAFNGIVSINPVSTSLTSYDLEVRNATGGNPANAILRQSASNTTSNTVLGNLFFGDNHSTTGQAQISAIRGAAGGAGDLPTDMLFYTTPDASTTLTERMRITNRGSIGMGTSTVATTDFFDINPSGMTGGTQWGIYLTMPNATTSNTIGFRLDNNNALQTGSKTGFWSQVGGADGAATTKRAYYGQATGNAGVANGGRFEAIGTTGVTDNYGIFGYASGTATNNYALYGEVGTAATNNYSLALKDGHIKSIQTTAPTITAATTYVLGSQSISNATDIAGNLSIVTTAAAGSVTITFNRVYAAAPIVQVTPTNANAATDINKLFITSTTTGFTLNFTASPAANTKTFNYIVIETN